MAVELIEIKVCLRSEAIAHDKVCAYWRLALGLSQLHVTIDMFHTEQELDAAPSGRKILITL